MKYHETFNRILAIILLVTIGYIGCSQKPDVEIEGALNELKSYQFGDSRAALSHIDTIVAQMTDDDDKRTLASRFGEILQENISFAARQFICQQLRLIGNAEQVPVLKDMLMDEEYSDIALFALEPISSPEVDRVLIEALPKLDEKAKVGVINALGFRQTANAVTSIAPLLADSDHQIAEATALTLGKIGTLEAASEIKKAMDTPIRKWGEKLGYCYLMCADQQVAQGNPESAIEIYKELSARTENKQIKMHAQSGLVSAGQLKADNFVRQAIKEDDPVIRRLAVRLVIETPGNDLTLKYCELLSDLPPTSQTLLLAALSDRGDNQALQTVLTMMDNKNKEVRIAALLAISKLGDETVVSGLMETIVNSEGEEREAARVSLYQLKGRQVNQKILQLIEDEKVIVRQEGMKALTIRHAVEATPSLIQLLDDPQQDIRKESWMALGELGSGADLSPMISYWLNIKNAGEIKTAEDAVVQVCRKEDVRKMASTEILTAMDKSERNEIKLSLINALGRIGDENALPQLRKQLIAKDPDIKMATIRALSIWPTDEPLQDLRQVITTTEDEQQKVVALRGYIHLIGLGLNRDRIKTIELYQDAMELTWRPDEKKLVLAGYSQIHQIEALLAVDTYLSDKDLKNEAAAAAITISNELIEDDLDKNHREKIGLSMDNIIKNCDVQSIRSQAREIMKTLED